MYLWLMRVFLYFLLTSFLGYIIEVIYCSLQYKKFMNRGFLFGPVCPIYGVGSTLITVLLTKYASDLLVLFVMGMLITSAVEYYTSYFLEKIFHNRWWDYSVRKDNINGRIRLSNSILFGLGTCFIIRVFNPFLFHIEALFSSKVICVIGTILLILFLLDFIFSIIIAYNLRHRLIIAEELKSEKLRMLPVLIEKKYQEEIKNLRFVGNRLFNAFPDILKNNKKEQELISKMQSKVKPIRNKERKSKRKNKKVKKNKKE